MTEILMYWSNVCVLHKQEQAFLESITAELLQEGIRLETRFFGLGYPQRLAEYLASADAVWPDIMVSTDLEIYEDSRIYSRFKDQLYPIGQWHPVKDDAATRTVMRGEVLLPYISIPLVFATANPQTCEGKGIADMIGTPFAFGGINNSAAKTVVKAVWERFGEDAARTLLANATVTDMPIQAFGRARNGQSDVALTPTLYALRADEQTLFARCPTDGAALIPSYICALDKADEAAVRRVVQALTAPDILSYFVSGGDLLCHLEGSPDHAWMQQQPQRFTYPSGEWVAQLSPEAFYALYKSYLPQAAAIEG